MDLHEYKEKLVRSLSATGVVFPESEYRKRLEHVGKDMATEGLDGLLVTDYCNLFYLTGYYTFGAGNHACLVLPLEGEPTLQVGSLEIPAAVVNTRVKDIEFSVWQRLYHEGPGEELAKIVKEKG